MIPKVARDSVEPPRSPTPEATANPCLDDIMARRVQSMAPARRLSEAAELMHRERVSCVLVCEDNKPRGILTERDLAAWLQVAHTKPHAPEPALAEVMSSPVITALGSATLKDASTMMAAHEIRHLAVVDHDGYVLGVVTQTDVVWAQSAALKTEPERLESAVADRTEQLRRTNAELSSLSLLDPLTGLGNRRSMELRLQDSQALARRYQRLYSLVLLDVDHFKLYNDRYGHPEGDRVLEAVGGALRARIRETDGAFRYGGEEFLVLLTDTDSASAQLVAGDLLNVIRGLEIPHPDNATSWVTVSAGVATFEPGIDGWRQLVGQADQAQYTSKRRGRNRLTAWVRDLAAHDPPVDA